MKEFQHFFDHSSDFLCQINRHGRIEIANNQFLNLSGYTLHELQNNLFSYFVHPDDTGKSDDEFKKLLDGNTTVEFALRFRIKAGEYIWIEWNISGDNMTQRWYAIGRNITERKKAEDKIKENEEKFRLAFMTSLDAFYIATLEEGRIIEVNDNFYEVFGYSKEETIGKTSLELNLYHQPEDRIRMVRELKDNGMVKDLELIGRKKEGKLITVSLSVNLFELENTKFILGVIRDITESKILRQKLTFSEEKYRNIFEYSSEGVFLTKPTGEILSANPEACRLLGRTEEEICRIGRNGVINLNDPRVESAIRDREVTGLLKAELTFVRNDGTIFPVDLTSTVFNDIQGEKRTVIFFRDISERKRIEAELTERKEKLDLFIEHSPASLAMLDTNLRYIATSMRWITDYKLFGQEIIGRTHYELFPEIPQRWKEIHQRCLKGAIESCDEDLFLRADGSMEWLKWEIRPWHKANGVIGGIVMFTEVITERKKATDLFNHQFNNSPDTIFIINKTFHIELINHGVKGGLSAQELIGMNCLELLPKSEREITTKNIHACFETGLTQTFQHRVGSDRWYNARVVALPIGGDITHVMIIAQDITAQRDAEHELKLSEEKHRALIENISDTIILLNESLEVVYRSASFIRTSGWPDRIIKGKSVLNFVHPDDIPECERIIELARNTNSIPIPIQFRVIHRNGYYIWVEGTATNLLRNESVKHYVISYRDITERKKFEEQQLLISSIVNSSDDAIISKSTEGIITTWNTGAERILGYKADEIIGKSITLIIPPELIQEEQELMANLQSDISVNRFETQRVMKNGERIYVSITLSPIRDTTGKITGVSKILRDISFRKAMELERENTIKELQQRNRDLEQFSHIVSHNLRGPVANIIGLSNLISDYNPNEHDIKRIIEGLNASAHSLDSVISDLNLILNMKHGMSEKRDRIKFSELLDEVKTIFEEAIQSERVQIEASFDSVNEINTIRSYMHSIFYNLISNSIKYRQPDLDPVIEIRSEKIGKKVFLVFKDNGLGINLEEEEEHVFSLFRRFHTHVDGKGMGLYMVKTQVGALNGNISIKSEVNKGTEFRLEFENAC